MKRTLSHQCPECFQVFRFSYPLPILTKRGAERTIAGAVLFELEVTDHHIDHANERIQLILEDERLEGGFLHDEAKRESYTENE